ncbi:MAG TPA: MBL fold metallo-hydrolase, partial [Patescibacteria group bacterium]|nr:MBL fold metallo-hydrolase [Patescibacteria group bacterium]
MDQAMQLEIRVSRKAWLALALLALMSGLVWAGIWQYTPDGKLHVTVYDVGQGDAIFLRTPTGVRVLVDGGPDQEVLKKVGEELPFFDRRIDLVVLTHPHADHIA